MAQNFNVDDAINKCKKYKKKALQMYKFELDLNDQLKNELAAKIEEVSRYKEYAQIHFLIQLEKLELQTLKFIQDTHANVKHLMEELDHSTSEIEDKSITLEIWRNIENYAEV